jgi:hypothetical protein
VAQNLQAEAAIHGRGSLFYFLKSDDEVIDGLLLLGSDSSSRTVKIVWHLVVDWSPVHSARLKVAESIAAVLVFVACLAF